MIRRNKYRVRTDAKGREDRTADNIVFHSKREMLRYLELRASYRAGLIKNLCVQVRFPIIVEGLKICDYICDFTYQDLEGNLHVEDSKGFRTDTYKLKRKLFEATYPKLRITEV